MGNKHSKFISMVFVLIFICQNAASAGLDSLRPSAYADRKSPPGMGIAGILDEPEYYPELVSGIKNPNQFKALRRHGKFLQRLYAGLSPGARKTLLDPGMMLMILGARHMCAITDGMDIERFCEELPNKTQGRGINFIITDHFVIDADYFLDRIREEGGHLARMGIISRAEVDFLSSGPMDKSKVEWIYAMVENQPVDPVKQITMLAFMVGYPIKYVQMAANMPGGFNKYNPRYLNEIWHGYSSPY